MSVLRHLELLEKYLPINVIFFLLFQYQIIVCQLFKSKSEICCDGLNRNLCCCKGNNDYFSTLELYAMHDGKSHGKMHPMSSVCFSQLLSAVGYDRIRFHGAQCVEIISEAKVFFMNISTIYFLYSFILTMNVPNVRTYKGMSKDPNRS